MKRNYRYLSFVVTFFIIVVLTYCNKDESLVDYRDNVVGKYLGIKIHTYYNGNLDICDTTLNISMILSFYGDSLVDLSFNPSISQNYRFKYRNNAFWDALGYNHPTKLEFSNDTLHFHVQSGLAYDFYDYEAI